MFKNYNINIINRNSYEMYLTIWNFIVVYKASRYKQKKNFKEKVG